MKLEDVKKNIDQYFTDISNEDFIKSLEEAGFELENDKTFLEKLLEGFDLSFKDTPYELLKNYEETDNAYPQSA